jgi:transposase
MIGIDVSKDSLSVCCWDDQLKQARWQAQFENSPAGIGQLLARSAAHEPWAVEPTGMYSRLVARTGVAHGRCVLQASPRAAKQFLASVHPRAKTDRLDAQGLARYASSVDLKPVVIKSDLMQRLSELLCARRSLSRSLSTFRQQAQALPEAREQLLAAASSVAQHLRELDRELERLARQEPQIKRLMQLPGVGPVTAATLVVRLTSVPFATSDQVVAYVGLDLRVRDSGQHRGQRKLTKHGDAELRRLLYLAAQATLRSKDTTFALQYERERAKGLATTQALCAVARKIARVAWSLVRHRAEYDPQRVYSQPAP